MIPNGSFPFIQISVSIFLLVITASLEALQTRILVIAIILELRTHLLDEVSSSDLSLSILV